MKYINILLHGLPAFYTVIIFNGYWLWLLSTLLFPLSIYHLLLDRYSNLYSKILSSLLLGLFSFVNITFLSSLYFQGAGFNEQFFYHIDNQTLEVAIAQFGAIFFLSIIYICICTILPLIPYKKKLTRLPAIKGVCYAGIAAMCYLPAQSALSFFGQRSLHSKKLIQSIDNKRPSIDTIPSIKLKNIVLIYAESLESLYFNKDIFGNITPGINNLKSKSLDFVNIHQVPGTEWTIAGIAASQCGLPLIMGKHWSSNTTIGSIKNPFPNQNCFADILSANGYQTVFMGGASHKFAGKGNFLRTHGYKKILGKDELQPLLKKPDYNLGWGIYDDSLLNFAKKELHKLAAEEKPFLLTLLTLDTHHPNGHPSASCNANIKQKNPILNAVSCSDQLLTTFIEEVLFSYGENTLIILFSDHLAMRNSVWNTLKDNQKSRRLTFMVMGSGITAQRYTMPATHFDIAPTILELAGISTHLNINFGQSLISHTKGRWFELDKKSREIDSHILHIGYNITLNNGIDFEIETGSPAIRIGQYRYQANYNGESLKKGNIFAMLFDDNRKFQGFISAHSLQDMQKQCSGFNFVGIASSEALISNNSTQYSYFIGNKTLQGISAPLIENKHIKSQELQEIFLRK